MIDIIKTVQGLEDSNILLKGVTETVTYVTRYTRCKFIR